MDFQSFQNSVEYFSREPMMAYVFPQSDDNWHGTAQAVSKCPGRIVPLLLFYTRTNIAQIVAVNVLQMCIGVLK